MTRRLVLRRTGGRPLCFDGITLERGLWRFGENGGCVLGLHKDAGGLVGECACLPPSGLPVWPWHAAACLADAEAAIFWFEALAPDWRAGPAARSSLRDQQARLCVQAALRAAFAQAVGQFLHEVACSASQGDIFADDASLA